MPVLRPWARSMRCVAGGTGVIGAPMAMRGMHDWLGFTQSLAGWSIVDSMTFKLTFTTYYEAALRELTYIPVSYTHLTLPTKA